MREFLIPGLVWLGVMAHAALYVLSMKLHRVLYDRATILGRRIDIESARVDQLVDRAVLEARR